MHNKYNLRKCIHACTTKQLAYESTVDADASVEAPKLYSMKHFLFTWNAIAAFTKVRSKNLSLVLLLYSDGIASRVRKELQSCTVS